MKKMIFLVVSGVFFGFGSGAGADTITLQKNMILPYSGEINIDVFIEEPGEEQNSKCNAQIYYEKGSDDLTRVQEEEVLSSLEERGFQFDRWVLQEARVELTVKAQDVQSEEVQRASGRDRIRPQGRLGIRSNSGNILNAFKKAVKDISCPTYKLDDDTEINSSLGAL